MNDRNKRVYFIINLLFIVFDIFINMNVAISQTSFHSYKSIFTGSAPDIVTVGDINNDGRDDVIMVTSYYFDEENDFKLFVFYSNQDGTISSFRKYVTSIGYNFRGSSVDTGDVNGDGLVDIVIGIERKGIEIFYQDKYGGLVTPSTKYYNTRSEKIRIGDINNDDLSDVVGIGYDWNSGDEGMVVYHQNLQGNLDQPVFYPLSIGNSLNTDLAIDDINNDKLKDIIVLSGWIPQISIVYQDLQGELNPFRSIPLDKQANPQGLAIGDLNNDNLNDISLTYTGNGPGKSYVKILYQDIQGNFNTTYKISSYEIPKPISIADVNNDGLQDIIVLHDAWSTMGIYYQNHDDTFSSEVLFSTPSHKPFNNQSLATGYLNNDNLIDVVLPIKKNSPVDDAGIAIFYNFTDFKYPLSWIPLLLSN